MTQRRMRPRQAGKLRRALGKGKSAAQKRYQRLLQLRHKASALLSMRQARQAHGIDARALEERRRLVQQTRALLARRVVEWLAVLPRAC